jgi:prophage regulatory protein
MVELAEADFAEVPRLITAEEVYARTTLSRTTIQRHVKSGSFPPPVRISAQRVAWPEAAVNAWMGALTTVREFA